MTGADIEALKADVRRLREEAVLDDNASRSSRNPDCVPVFAAWAASKRRTADSIEALIAQCAALVEGLKAIAAWDTLTAAEWHERWPQWSSLNSIPAVVNAALSTTPEA